MPSRLLRNVASNWLVITWTIGWGIALVPIYLHYLGTANYGIWVLVNAVIGYYGLLDLGIKPALMRHVARFIGFRDDRGLNEIFNTGWMMQAGLGVVVLAGSAVMAVFLPRLEGFALGEFSSAGLLLLLFGSGAALSFIGGAFSSAINGAERFDISNLLVLGSSFVVNVSHVLVLHHGGGLIGMAVVILCARLLEIPFAMFAGMKAIPQLRLDPRLFRRARVRELFGYGAHAFVTAAGERLRFATDAVVISSFLPASAVAIFNIGNRPMNFLMEFVRGISNVLTPNFSRKEAADSPDDMARLLATSTRVTSLLAFLGCLLLAVAGDRLLTLWLGAGYDESFLIMLILIPAYLMETSLAPTGSFLLGTRGYSTISKVIICEGLSNLVLSLLLVRSFGLIGVALGTAIPMVVVRLVVLPWLAARIAGIGYVELLRNSWLPALPAVAVAALVASVLDDQLPGRDLLSVVAFVGLVAGTYCVVALLTLWIRNDELLPRRLQRARQD